MRVENYRILHAINKGENYGVFYFTIDLKNILSNWKQFFLPLWFCSRRQQISWLKMYELSQEIMLKSVCTKILFYPSPKTIGECFIMVLIPVFLVK